MSINAMTEECLQLLEDAKNTIHLLNSSIKEYNQKRKELNQILIDDPMQAGINQILVDGLKEIKIEDLYITNEKTDTEYEIINTSDDNPIIEKEEYDKYDEMGDFEMNTGSKSRCLKGTGKNNIKDVYSTKHVRVALSKSKK